MVDIEMKIFLSIEQLSLIVEHIQIPFWKKKSEGNNSFGGDINIPHFLIIKLFIY